VYGTIPHMRCVRVRISGHVQGVFFRVSCARLAEELGLSGWVRNRPDGDLEAVFQGPDQAVEEMLAWCREGPPHARVTGVDVHAEPPVSQSEFRIEP
jgi:acylphosphatase